MYLIPAPREMQESRSVVLLGRETKIYIDKAFGIEATGYGQLLRDKIFAETGAEFELLKGTPEADEFAICLCKEDEILADTTATPEQKAQGYELYIENTGITLKASDYPGLLYGVQTIAELVKNHGLCLSGGVLKDYPLLLNRGFYHDATRSRIQTLESYKRLADTLAEYKLNQLQLYVEHTYLFKDFSEVWRDDTPLTAEDILELDAYCRKLQIELVPSIATFGHLYKVLRTQCFRHFSELPDISDEPFSFDQRMQHHTLDVTNEESAEFVKKMLAEFIPLFSSKYFNICADETFDLGTGKSKSAAEEKGVAVLYTTFLKRIMEFVISEGKIPMFWGDIIVGFPEYAKEFPKEVICLNWGYSENEKEDAAQKLDAVGMKQYLCPGVQGWRHFINRLGTAYRNIAVMSEYAVKYNALGLLNTDWGDFGHLQDPEFSIPGLIYGACFSWSGNIPEKEINEQISKSCYGDMSGMLMEEMKKLSECEIVTWERFVNMKEWNKYEIFPSAEEANGEIDRIVFKMLARVHMLNERGKTLVGRLALFAEGQKLVNDTPKYLTGNATKEEKYAFAAKLEHFMYDYKKVWRKTSRESELYRIEEVFYYYADRLRQ